MRYATAVRRLRTIAESCDRARRLWDEPVLAGGYVFGDVLDGPADLPRVQVALVCPGSCRRLRMSWLSFRSSSTRHLRT